jgi:hypothetical protein
MEPLSRRRFLAATGLAALAGCSTRGDTADGDPSAGDSDATPTADPGTPQSGSGSGSGSGAAVPTADGRLPLSMSPGDLRDAARSGGPPKDGIPSIDDPAFVAAGAVDYLDPGDPVFGVVRGSDAKAYPQKILAQHEIVNDRLDGQPVSVTYCPLTGTVQGFERGETTFGVSGRLINNNLVMYDRATETWWPQILATSIPGPWNEDPAIRSLREFRLVWTTWERWREHNPDTRVLSTDTGHAKNYGRDPYGEYNPRSGYYSSSNLLFPALGDDDRYDRKTVVMGARTPEGAVAFPKDALRDAGLVEGSIGDTPVLAVYDPRLDTAYVYLNPEETAFEYDDGSVLAPDGTAHDPDAVPLARVHAFDAMWFAWSGYYPDTNVYA